MKTSEVQLFFGVVVYIPIFRAHLHTTKKNWKIWIFQVQVRGLRIELEALEQACWDDGWLFDDGFIDGVCTRGGFNDVIFL